MHDTVAQPTACQVQLAGCSTQDAGTNLYNAAQRYMLLLLVRCHCNTALLQVRCLPTMVCSYHSSRGKVKLRHVGRSSRSGKALVLEQASLA